MKTQTNKNRPQKVKTSSKNKNNNEAVSAAGATNRRRQSDTQPKLPSTEKGGQTTNSPPAKVKSCNNSLPRILSSGIDTLYLAITLIWENDNFFNSLAELKRKASSKNEPQTLAINRSDNSDTWLFEVKPYGGKRYEWWIENNEYTLKIGNWMEPKQRPSVMVEIRSETLWSHGRFESVNRVFEFLVGQGANILIIKPSRVDLCVDMLLDENLWTMELDNYAVTRSNATDPHFRSKKFTGLSYGKKKVVARLYDKPLEIKTRKKKEWMYDIWEIKSVPDGKRIIRVEFQLRRQALNELCLHNIFDLLKHLPNVWAYCTQEWLKFQDNPEKHHTQRNTLEWWEVVQNGFMGQQHPNPLIRNKAIQEDSNNLLNQACGNLTSVHAIQSKGNYESNELVTFEKIVEPLREHYSRNPDKYYGFKEEVRKKSVRFSRAKIKSQEAASARIANGFPCTKPGLWQPALEQELKEPAPSPSPTIGSASDKPNCHRLAGPAKPDD
ncbi:MAG: hypothetical protein ACTSQ8_24370 [Candidatus Helarchaeota archaeon]